jgi:MFS family permease
MDTATAVPDIAVTETSTVLAERRYRRIAWSMLAVSMIGGMCCSTAVILANTGVFMEPLSRTLGWSRGDIALSLSMAALAMAAANPVVGRLIDRYGVKPVLVVSLLAYGLSIIATPLLIDAFGIWGLYAGFVLIASLGAGSNIIAYVRILSSWFSGAMNHHRGLAMGCASAGLALGVTVTAPLAVQLIAHLGWRGAFWVLSLLPLLIALPLTMVGIRMPPGDTGEVSSKTSAEALPGLTAGEAMRTRTFWLMAGIVFLMSGSLQGIQIHMAPLLTDLGMNPGQLALLLGVIGLIAIAARITAGFLFDRFFAPHISVCIFGLAVVATFALAFTQNIRVAVIATIIQIIGAGAESDLIAYLIGRYFGLRAYGQIFGWIYGVFMVAIALGPYLFGIAFDTLHSYQVPLIGAGVGVFVVCLLLLALPRFPAKMP